MKSTTLGILSILSMSSVSAMAQSNVARAAQKIVVDASADSLDGSCLKDAVGQCNLRSAVAAAQALTGEVKIVLTVDSIIDQGEIVINAPQTLDLKIKGQKEMKSIQGSSNSRLFQVAEGAKLDLENILVSTFSSWDAGVVLNNGSIKMRNIIFRDNKATCSGVGAMTAYATCAGGVFSNGIKGSLTLGNGTVFEDNQSIASASTASYTTSSTSGGAITSSGTILLNGTVSFHHNIAKASANSGYHPMPNGGATATATGGAIYNAGGTVKVSKAGKGKCSFTQNEAAADASTPFGSAVPNSIGGAIGSTGGSVIGVLEGCTFEGNVATTGPDTNFAP